MKCLSCTVEIDPKWKFAIEQNICPFCGEPIMDAALKDLFSSLRTTMDALQQYPEQLEDWLFSNFSFLKTTSSKLADFVDPALLKKTKKEDVLPEGTVLKIAGQDVPSQKKMTDDKASDFLKRAGVVKKNDATPVIEKENRIRNMVNQIKSGGIESTIDPDAEGVDPEALRQYQEEMSGFDENQSSLGGSISSGPSIDFGGGEELPFEVEALVQQTGGGGNNQKDLHILRRMRERQRNSRDNFETGENRPKGGFSRA